MDVFRSTFESEMALLIDYLCCLADNPVSYKCACYFIIFCCCPVTEDLPDSFLAEEAMPFPVKDMLRTRFENIVKKVRKSYVRGPLSGTLEEFRQRTSLVRVASAPSHLRPWLTLVGCFLTGFGAAFRLSTVAGVCALCVCWRSV